LTKNETDALDHNLPLMLWYAAEPLAELDPSRAIALAEKSKMPKMLNYMIQRIGAVQTEEAKKTLKALGLRLGHSHENHENMMLIEKLLETKH
jgi:predicted lipid carrier protein YhbT